MSMIGESLAHYRVTEKIGAGGMGEVYKATDSRLNRSVAIKILPDEFTHDHDRLARLHREAQVLASLNHPNIAAVYGLEESNGRRALVMELAEGEDLAHRLRSGPIPLQQALRIALGIAEALEAAHERGVIHRDLKPGNIKVAADGHVKVLDFGLAKALDPDTSSVGDPSHSPTLSLAATRAGLILGTAAYMSPEQASGAPVDKRADIWAFGVVLFEMLAGSRLFQGESVSHTLADVLRSDIDWNRLPQNTPRSIRRLLERCLDRDLKHRLRDIGEARIAIEEELASSSSSATRTPAPAPARARAIWTILPWALAAAAILVAGAIAVLAPRGTATPLAMQLDSQIAHGPLFSSLGSAIELSRDGSLLAFAIGDDTSGELHVRRLNSLASTKLAEGRTANQVPYHPFLSPDGEWVGYATPNEIRKVPVAGGTAVTIAKVSRSRGATWGSNGAIVVAAGPGVGLSKVSTAGGELTPLTELNKEAGETSHRWPQFLPGDEAVLFTSARGGNNFDSATLEVVTIATGERKVIHTGGSYGRYVPSGHLIYLNKATIFAVPFDLSSLSVKGSPVPVVQTVTASANEGGAQITFSENGLLAYVRGGPLIPEYPAVWVDRNGRIETLISEPGAYANPRISPDGKRIAVSRLREGNWDIWVHDIERQVSTRLTFPASTETEQIWSPDGQELMYSSDRHGPDGLFRKAADGSGDERLVAKTDTATWASGWTPQYVTYTTLVKNGLDAGMIAAEGAKPQTLLAGTFDEADPVISPDGRWLAYTSTESGQPEVYVRSFPSGGGRWQISDGGGAYPRWNRNGRELFFRSARGIMAAAIETSGAGLRAERPRKLFEGAFRGGVAGLTIAGHTMADYDVSPDGTRFAMFPAAASAAEQRTGVVTFATTWFDDLKRAFEPR
jgi:serine/threonine-protein kinase